MKIYVYSKCSTCQEALRFLKRQEVKVTVKEIVETPPSIEELRMMLQHQKGSLKKLFNVSGNLYRDMRLAEKFDQMSEIEALELLSKNGMLVKRPFLLGDGFGILGFKESEWSEWWNVFSK